MKKIFFVAAIISVFASIMPAQNQKELGFDFDYARFNYDTTAVFLEFYYGLNLANMQAKPTDQGLLIEAIVHIEMKNVESGAYFIKKDWKIQNLINPNESDSIQKTLTGVFGFVVPGGKYALQIIARDAQNPDLTKTISETILLQPFRRDKFCVSEIELASYIKKENADPKSLFYKNTFEVIPNPLMVYSNRSPVLFFYAELYNLKLENEKTNFTLQKILYNSSDVPIYKSTKNINQSKDAVVELGLINLLKYPTDSYNLVLSLIDPTTNQTFVSSKRFYLYNPGIVDSTSRSVRVDGGVLGSEFGIYDSEECDKLFSEAKYIAANDEINQYKKLDSLNAKREFLFKFWKARDDNPATAKNEYKENYMNRVALANKNYSRMNKEGYLTDRGRVVLLYGTPDQKDYFPSEAEMKPYETWFYNQIEGGVSFIFGDVTGFGNYELLHSTKRGEIQDENWIRRLRTAAQ